MKPIIFMCLVCAAVLASIGEIEISLWHECRATPHSWLYCVRVIGSR